MSKWLVFGGLTITGLIFSYYGQKYSLPRMGLHALSPGAFLVTMLFATGAITCSTLIRALAAD